MCSSDLLQTRSALVAYSVGLTGLILVKVLAPGFYSRQDIRTPVKIALISLAATQAMNLLFVLVMDLRHAGLALAIGLAACLNAAMLWQGLRRSGAYRPQAGWPVFLLRLLAALVILVLVLWAAMGVEANWLTSTPLARLTRLTLVVLAGLTAYFGALALLGFRLRDFRRTLRK